MKPPTTSKPKLIKKRTASAKQRNSSSHRNPKHSTGAIQQEGKEGQLLAHALDYPLSSSGKKSYAFTQGFHSYPGRFHPHLARCILSPLEPEANFRVFDPFMGGGTALMEGMCQGLEVLGNDLNPIATLVARERCRFRSPAESQKVLEMATRLQNVVLNQKTTPKRKIIRRTHVSWLRPHYAPHLFVELLYWIDAIDKLPPSSIKETLRIVFSSTVFRFSNDALQISKEQKPPSIPKGSVSEWIFSNTRELLEQQKALYRKIPPHTQRAELFTEDIGQFNSIPQHSIDLILTSPSAPNSYDYYEHYLIQLKWLKLSAQALKTHDMGSKRFSSSNKQWKQKFRSNLFQLRKLLKPSGSCYLNIHDWLDREKPVNALDYIKKYAPSVGWEILGTASRQISESPRQTKFYQEKGKWEHLIHLKNPQKPSSASEPTKPPLEME